MLWLFVVVVIIDFGCKLVCGTIMSKEKKCKVKFTAQEVVSVCVNGVVVMVSGGSDDRFWMLMSMRHHNE